jgi:hypothetical protein
VLSALAVTIAVAVLLWPGGPGGSLRNAGGAAGAAPDGGGTAGAPGVPALQAAGEGASADVGGESALAGAVEGALGVGAAGGAAAAVPAAGPALPAEPALPEGLFATEARIRDSADVLTREIPPGGTLTWALDSLGLSQAEATAALAALTREGVLDAFRQGGRVTAHRAPAHKGGALERLDFLGEGQARPATLVPGGPNGFVYFTSAPPALDLQMAFRGTVRQGQSFREAFLAAGLTEEAAGELAELLASQIDFLSDTRPGDSFQLLYRGVWEEERLLSRPTLLMVSVVNLDHRLEFFRREGRRPAFYDSEFRSVKKPLLASPLLSGLVAPAFPEAEREGIPRRDLPGRSLYVAPQGAAVASVAAGTVKFAGRRGALGNLVVVRHDGGGGEGYESFYSHLAGFAEGVEAGASVSEGQILGKVGMSGATLTPVLDYRLRRGGQPLDPRLELMEVRGEMLDADLRADFAELVGIRRVALSNLLALEIM